MRSLAGKYPWYDGAVIASFEGEPAALPIHIRLLKSLRPSLVLHRRPELGKPAKVSEPVEIIEEIEIVAADIEPCTPNESKLSTIAIIDDFIDKGDYKVAPTGDTPDFIPDSVFEGIPEDDELLTEELAEVYLNQGLFDQAKSIYERLSLLYPKKSVYFAEIIENADRRKGTAGNNTK